MSIPRLIALNFLVRLAAAASGQLFAFLLADRLASQQAAGSALVGFLGACYFATELLGAPIAGRQADVHGQHRVLSFGPIFGAVTGVVAATAVLGRHPFALPVALTIARTLEGASAACAVPTTLVLLSRATEGDAGRRTRVMGVFEITSLVGLIAGYGVAGVGWDALGASSFLLLPAVYTAAWLLIGSASVPEPHRASRPGVLQVVRTLTREPSNLAFGVAWLAVNAVVGVWIQQAPYLLALPSRSPTQTLVGGYSGKTVGVIFGVWGLTFLLGIALWSAFGARVPRRRTMSITLFSMLGVAGTLALANRGASSVVFVLASLFVAVEAGFTPAALAHLADITERQDASRGAALGLYSLLLGSGQLLGNVLGAPFAAAWQMNGVLFLTAILASLSLVAVRFMTRGPGPVSGANAPG